MGHNLRIGRLPDEFNDFVKTVDVNDSQTSTTAWIKIELVQSTQSASHGTAYLTMSNLNNLTISLRSLENILTIAMLRNVIMRTAGYVDINNTTVVKDTV